MPDTKKNTKTFPFFLIFIGVVLIVAASAYLLGFTYQSQKTGQDNASNPSIPLPEIQRVSLKDARAAFEIGSAVFLDVRGSEYYQQGHIPGAFSIPEDQLSARIGELSPDDWIITYCT